EASASAWYPQTIRSFCGVPTAAWVTADPAGARHLATAWALQGRKLCAVATSGRALRSAGVPLAKTRSGVVPTRHGLDRTLNMPPRHYRPSSIKYAYGIVPS